MEFIKYKNPEIINNKVLEKTVMILALYCYLEHFSAMIYLAKMKNLLRD